MEEVPWCALLDCGHWTFGKNTPVLIPEPGWVLPCFAHTQGIVRPVLKIRESRVLDVIDTRPLGAPLV